MAAMHALRLHPGDELFGALKKYCTDNNIKAAYIATCVGSLQACTLRLANADRDRPNEIKTYDQRFEIVSVVGTISCEGAHIHLGLADATGAGVGGDEDLVVAFRSYGPTLGEDRCGCQCSFCVARGWFAITGAQRGHLTGPSGTLPLTCSS